LSNGISQGCEQDSEQLHWHIQRSDWQAELYLDIDQLTVRYIQAGKKDKTFNALQVFPQSARYRTGRFAGYDILFQTADRVADKNIRLGETHCGQNQATESRLCKFP